MSLSFNTTPRTAVVLRGACPDDAHSLAALNRAAYPDLVTEGVVYDEAQILAQLAVFPAGQRIAEIDGKIVGAISTLIVSERDALADHDWIGITGYGCFATHRPDGDALYLADVYVHPSARRLGVGAALYGELRAMCRER